MDKRDGVDILEIRSMTSLEMCRLNAPTVKINPPPTIPTPSPWWEGKRRGGGRWQSLPPPLHPLLPSLFLFDFWSL